MAQVHLFPLDNNLHADTRVPFQFRGGGQGAAARAFQLSALVSFMQDNLAIPNVGPNEATVTLAAPNVIIGAGVLVEKIVVIGTTTGTFQLGTTPGSSNILDNSSEYTPNGTVFAFNQYFHAAGLLCFSGFTGTLTVKIYTR
jgi:hypothetical protein